LSQSCRSQIDHSIYHYSISIDAIVHKAPSTEVVLLTSMLFWTYDNFNGRTEHALRHLNGAINILKERRNSSLPVPRDDFISLYIEPTFQEGMTYTSIITPLCGNGGQLLHIHRSICDGHFAVHQGI